MVITIDGLDGSGKSTLARNLSAYYDYVFMDKPISHFYNQFIPLNKQIIEKMQENISNINSDFLNAYYSTLSLVYFQKTMKNQNIILNGGLLTSYLENGNSNTKELYETLIKQGLLRIIKKCKISSYFKLINSFSKFLIIDNPVIIKAFQPFKKKSSHIFKITLGALFLSIKLTVLENKVKNHGGQK